MRVNKSGKPFAMPLRQFQKLFSLVGLVEQLLILDCTHLVPPPEKMQGVTEFPGAEIQNGFGLTDSGSFDRGMESLTKRLPRVRKGGC